MSEVSYVKCDGCGLHDVHNRDEPWRRSRIDGWVEAHIYDRDEEAMTTFDYCSECWSKMVKAVE